VVVRFTAISPSAAGTTNSLCPTKATSGKSVQSEKQRANQVGYRINPQHLPCEGLLPTVREFSHAYQKVASILLQKIDAKVSKISASA